MLALLVGGLVAGVQVIQAGTLQNTIGWLWGGTDATGGGTAGPGWMSLNSRDCDPDASGTVDAAEVAARPGCPGLGITNYGVNIPASGVISGYGWSEHYGWVSFNAGDVAGCPVQGACDARRVGNALVGWARVLAIRDAGANAGGWTGFVSLDSGTTGSAVPYGVTISGSTLSGYAWSDELGWIDFSGATISPASVLTICQNSCGSGVLRGDPTKIGSSTMGLGSTENLVACFGPDVACGDGASVPVSAVWYENTGNATVSLAASGTTEVVTANAVGSEQISASYGGQAASLNVGVVCIPVTCAAAVSVTNDYCPDETRNTGVANGCGGTLSCPGTRYCDTNYKEVQP